MTSIYKKTLLYSLAKAYMLFAFRMFYGKIIIRGKENIPNDSGFIIAPNHRNALMDALVAALITPKGKTTSFLARSDLFHNKLIAKLMRFAKIMPAFRIRDGFENLTKNNEVFEECVDLLAQNQVLCIMPEGNQEIEHRLRPLAKGIFRIAFAVEQNNPKNNPLKILPVGIDFGDIEKFGKHVIINIGEPINVRDYSTLYSENPVAATNDLKEVLRVRLEEQMLHIDTLKYYNAIVRTLEIADYSDPAFFIQKKDIVSAYLNRKKLSILLNEKTTLGTEPLDALSADSYNLLKKLRKRGLRATNLNKEHKKHAINTLRTLLLTITAPLGLTGILLNFIPFQLPVLIRKMLRVEFRGFYSSIQMALGMIIFPIYHLLQAYFICLFYQISTAYILLMIPLFLLTGKIGFYWYKQARCSWSIIHFLLIPKKKKEKMFLLRKQIMKTVFN